MADLLDVNQALVQVDPVTGEYKATEYFETLWYGVIETLGGEGSTLVRDLESVTFESDRFYYYTGLVQKLRAQVDELRNTADNRALEAKIKTINRKLGELEALFDVARLEGSVKQIEIDTQGFYGRVETSNYTAVNKDWVEGRNGVTVKLPTNPLVNDQVIVSNGDGSRIIIDGNGNNIKYTKTGTRLITRNQGTSYHLQFFRFQTDLITETYWRIR